MPNIFCCHLLFTLFVKYFFVSKFQYYFNRHAIFEKFGTVRFVAIERRRDNGFIVGFIEFEDDSISDELISSGNMEIDDNTCQVQSYEEYERQSKLISATVLSIQFQ